MMYFLAGTHRREGRCWTRCIGCKKRFGMNAWYTNTIMTADWHRGGRGHTCSLSHTHLWWFPSRLLVLHSWTHVICMPPLQHTDRTAFGNTHLLITSLLCSLLFPDRCPLHTHTHKETRTVTHNSILYTRIFKYNRIKTNLIHKPTCSNKHKQTHAYLPAHTFTLGLYGDCWALTLLSVLPLHYAPLLLCSVWPGPISLSHWHTHTHTDMC